MINALNNPVLWALGLIALVAISFGLRAAIDYARVRQDAEEDFNYKQQQDMIPKGLSQDRYVDIYRRVNNPRAAGYVAGTLAAVLLATPVIFLVLEWGLRALYNLSGQDRVIEPGFLVWQFIIFFSVLIAWAAIAYASARRYHRRAPGSLQYEIDQEIYGREEDAYDPSDNMFNMPPWLVMIGVAAIMLFVSLVTLFLGWIIGLFAVGLLIVFFGAYARTQ